MSDLRERTRYDLSEIAGWLEVDSRTVRRWCEKGIVPGAYRAKAGNGHWRIRNPLKASLALMNRLPSWQRRRRSSVVGQEREAGPSISHLRSEIFDPNSIANLAKRLYFAHTHRVSYEEMSANKLRCHTAEMCRDLLMIPITELHKKIPRHFWLAARDLPLANLYLATSKLQFKQLPPTAKSLARELEISRASLYRRYSSAQIASALNSLGRMQASPFDTSAHAERIREVEKNVYQPFRHVS